MIKSGAYFLLCLLALSSLAFGVTQLNVDPAKFINNGETFLGHVPDRFIVVLKDDITVDHGKDIATNLALSDRGDFAALADQFKVLRLQPQFPGTDRGAFAASNEGQNLSRHYKVLISEGTLDEAMAAYAALPEVDHVEPISVHLVKATPNDGYYPTYQWHYYDTYGIDADLAWDSQNGDATVVVGVLDTGVKYDHGDLGGSNPPGPNDNSTNGNIWVNPGEIPGNGIDDDGNGYTDDVIGWDFVDRGDWYVYSCIDSDCGTADNDPFDGNGHGTHVAGTIAAITNNGYAVAGIAGGFGDGTFSGTNADGVKVIPCRIGYTLRYLNQDVGVVIMDYVAEGMYYLGNLKQSGVNVAAVNCSFGTSNDGGLGAACDFLVAQDVLVCVAAGNSGSSSADYLGARTDCLDVGATDQSGAVASFSNYGTWVDIAAPGVSIMSTTTDPADPTGDYIAQFDGTSMACPHVVGVAALLESQDPSLSATDKWNLMVNNTTPYSGTRYIGTGIVNAKDALDAMGPVNNPPVANFSGTPTSGEYPLTVNFTDLSTNTLTAWSWDFGDGVGTSTVQNPSYTYTSAGTYTVTLTATNAYGSDDEIKVDYITVTAPAAPIANFSGSPTSGEYPLTVAFTDLSTGSPTTWSWDFGDGVGTSTSQNPSYEYSAAGSYTVSLTVTSPYGSDTETKIDYITVTEPGVSSFAYAQSDIPVYGTVSGSFANTSSSDNSYEVITEIQYTGHPVKTYSYLEHKWDFFVSGSTSATFYVEAYRPANGDGDNFTFAYSTDDVTYTTLVTVASATEQVYSAALPSGLSGTVYIRVLDSDRSWSNVSLDPVYIDQMYIEYSSTPQPPVADFVGSPTAGYAPLTVNFTDLSTGAPTSWSWDFGDGSGTSTAQNPSYTYTAPGTYTVSLTASNAYGSDGEVKTGYITVYEQGTSSMHVGAMTVGRAKSGPNYVGTCTVTIVDDNSLAVSGATVYVTATGPTSGTYSGTTAADGTVSFQTGGVKKPSGEWCFEVTDVTHASYTYDDAANVATYTCESGVVYGDGNGMFEALPREFSLSQNHPNPFNPVTTIRFALPEATYVRLDVFNINGQRVSTLVDGVMNAGEHAVNWDGGTMASGIYFYKIQAGVQTETRKMILMK
ncbi:MAG: PKD domain-containing protein [Candidatus Zixiibacteriota bacterium]